MPTCRILTPLEIASNGLSGNKTKKLRICWDEVKGRGVVSDEPIHVGDFVCEYKYGVWFPVRDRLQAEKEHELNGQGSYILEVVAGGKKICLDATVNINSWGRLINHSPNRIANLKLHPPLWVRGKWRVAFLARKDKRVGEELSYDYGQERGMPSWMRRKVIY